MTKVPRKEARGEIRVRGDRLVKNAPRKRQLFSNAFERKSFLLHLIRLT